MNAVKTFIQANEIIDRIKMDLLARIEELGFVATDLIPQPLFDNFESKLDPHDAMQFRKAMDELHSEGFLVTKDGFIFLRKAAF